MSNAPRWLELQVEIDCLDWLLRQMLTAEKRRSLLDKMIDEATGFDKQKFKEAKAIIRRVKKLKAEFEALEAKP